MTFSSDHSLLNRLLIYESFNHGRFQLSKCIYAGEISKFILLDIKLSPNSPNLNPI